GVISVLVSVLLATRMVTIRFRLFSIGADNVAAAKTPEAPPAVHVDFMLRCEIATPARAPPRASPCRSRPYRLGSRRARALPSYRALSIIAGRMRPWLTRRTG